MKIRMTRTTHATANHNGTIGMDYVEGQTYEMNELWQSNIAQVFINEGWAEEIGGGIEKKVVAPKEIKRARNNDGTLKADDPSTKDVNEAWEGGKAPKKTSKKK